MDAKHTRARETAMNDKRDILRKAAIAKFEADEGLKPNGDDVIARADRMSMIAFGRGFDAGHAAATAEAQADGWVDVADRLPLSIGGINWPVIVTDRDQCVRVGTFVDDGFYLDNSTIKMPLIEIIAWQPLPAPYQRQSSEGE